MAWKRPRRQPVRVALARTVIFTIVFAIGIQIGQSIVLTKIDNDRSAKQVCRVAEAMLVQDPHLSVMVSQLPEEATVYLPPDLREIKDSNDVLVIADDRKGQADAAERAAA